MARTRGTRRASCKEMVCGSGGGIAKVLASEEAMALGGQTASCPKASCPAYTGVAVFLVVLYLFFVAVNWTFRPSFMRKPGSSPTNADNIEPVSGFLYALLWTGLVLIGLGLVMRCRACA